MKNYIEFCHVTKTLMAMVESVRTKINVVSQLISLLYLIAAVLLNLTFPNLILTYPLLGIGIVVGLVQLKNTKF